MSKLKTLAVLAALAATPLAAADLKVGMITTLSGGGAGLGIDVRDGFIQRSVRPPEFRDPDRFVRWLDGRHPGFRTRV